MTFLVVLAGALVVGATLGLLGGGGTVLTVPLVRMLLGLDTPHAIALSLPVVAAAAGTGSFVAWRRGFLSPGPAIELAATTSIGAWFGARAAQHLQPATQSLLLGITLLAAATLLWHRARRPPAAGHRDTLRGRRVWLALTGIGVGVLTGVVGVGGGFLIVPALVLLGGYTALEAVPISLFAITFSAGTATIGYRAVAVAWDTALVMAVAAVAGVLAGGALGRRLDPVRLQAVFVVVLFAAAGYILINH